MCGEFFFPWCLDEPIYCPEVDGCIVVDEKFLIFFQPQRQSAILFDVFIE